MYSTVQKTIYYPKDIIRIIKSIERSYLASNGGREDPTDGFITFTTLLASYISDNPHHSYLFEHVRNYAETTRSLLGKNCNEKAFEAVARAFDFYGKGF